MKTLLKILTIFIAIGAIAGAVMMWMDPSGVSWGGGPMLDMLRAKMPWPDVFFKDFIPSGSAWSVESSSCYGLPLSGMSGAL